MRIFSDQEILRLVEDFTRSWRARVWYSLADDLRNAILDSVMMDLVRSAHSADNETPITPAYILDLRQRFEARLARGVRGNGYATDEHHDERRRAKAGCSCDLAASDGQHVRACPARGVA
jgi:hypothetical protein